LVSISTTGGRQFCGWSPAAQPSPPSSPFRPPRPALPLAGAPAETNIYLSPALARRKALDNTRDYLLPRRTANDRHSACRCWPACAPMLAGLRAERAVARAPAARSGTEIITYLYGVIRVLCPVLDPLWTPCGPLMGPLLSPYLMPNKSGAILTDAFSDRPGYVTGFCRHLDGLVPCVRPAHRTTLDAPSGANSSLAAADARAAGAQRAQNRPRIPAPITCSG